MLAMWAFGYNYVVAIYAACSYVAHKSHFVSMKYHKAVRPREQVITREVNKN